MLLTRSTATRFGRWSRPGSLTRRRRRRLVDVTCDPPARVGLEAVSAYGAALGDHFVAATRPTPPEFGAVELEASAPGPPCSSVRDDHLPRRGVDVLNANTSRAEVTCTPPPVGLRAAHWPICRGKCVAGPPASGLAPGTCVLDVVQVRPRGFRAVLSSGCCESPCSGGLMRDGAGDAAGLEVLEVAGDRLLVPPPDERSARRRPGFQWPFAAVVPAGAGHGVRGARAGRVAAGRAPVWPGSPPGRSTGSCRSSSTVLRRSPRRTS